MFKSKGQVNLEFLAAALMYLIALGALVTVGSGVVPEFTDDAEVASLNLEARQISTKMLTTPGRYGSGNTAWETDNDTVAQTTSFGLGSGYLEVERDKIERLRTANPRSGFNYLNYSQFKQITGADNQYRFNFTWMPIVETPRSFTRCSPPFAANDGKPNITEPVACDQNIDTYYENAGNDVHYGSKIINGRIYRFLVTSHNGVYNTTYVSTDWDFSVATSREGIGDTFDPYSADEYRIENIQNRDREPGSMLMLSQHLKTFGANVDSDSQVISMKRYALMEGEPVRVRVLAW